MFGKLFRRPLAEHPWDSSRASVFSRIENISHGTDISLDDRQDSDEIRWAPGALDALFGAPSDTKGATGTRTLIGALGAMTRRPSTAAYRHLYDVLLQRDAIGIVDEVLQRLPASGLDISKVGAVAREIALEAPDINAVKFAIALLGLAGKKTDRQLLLTLGRYDELTLYAAVALQKLLPNATDEVWTLAKSVRGWGRIRAIQRLHCDGRSDVKAWLLREGWQTSIMTEEVAFDCAVKGGLLEALSEEEPDAALLNGAGALLSALVRGGPAEDMRDYGDGGNASQLYAEHVSRRDSKLERYLDVQSIADYAAEEPPANWTAENRWAIRTAASRYLGRPDWQALVTEGLQTKDQSIFWQACTVGVSIGMDVWPARFSRQEDGDSDQWYFLMQTDNPERIEQILDLARSRLDLRLVSSESRVRFGLGQQYRDDSALEFIVQDLKRFPGMGWDLIKVALHGRTIRLRNMATNALAAWGRAAWPADAEAELKAALASETDERARENMRTALNT